MIKIINDVQISRGIQLLTSALIFVSVSPLFETSYKLMVAALIVIGIYIVADKRFATRLKDYIILAVFFVILIFYGFILDVMYVGDVTYIGLGFFVFILLGFLVAQKVTRTEFLSANDNLVLISLSIGLPIYLFLQIFPGLIKFGFDYTYGSFSHKTFFAVNVLTYDGYSIQRFVGFGSEPGLTQIFYMLALFNRLAKNNGKLDVLVFLILVATFLSKSTFGILVALLILGTSISFKSFLKYFIIFLPIIYFVIIGEVAFHVSNKLWGTDSFAARYDRYIDFFGGDLLNVVLGYGNLYYSNVITISDLGGWDSFLQTSQRYGLFFTLFLFFCLFINNRGKQYPVFFIISLSFFTQSIWIMPAIAFFYFKGCIVCSKKSLKVA